MGTNVTLGVAAGATVAAEAEVVTGLGWAVAGRALADGVALDWAPAADDALALQADSASPAPSTAVSSGLLSWCDVSGPGFR